MNKTKLNVRNVFLSKTLMVNVSAVIFALVIMISCAKDGTDGSAILSGNGVPAITIGNAGDYYLDKSTSTLYGPKTENTWGTGIVLVGESGNTVLSGTDAPAADLGVVGDFYVDITTNSIYGPKSSSGWGSSTLLVGPAGANAEVKYTTWFNADATLDSRDTTIDGTCFKIRHKIIESLTSDAINEGAVLVYMRAGKIGPYPLPYISDAGGATNSIGFILKQGKLFTYRHTFNTCRFTSAITPAYTGQPVCVPLPIGLEYRVIIIPGITPLTAVKSSATCDVVKSVQDLTYEEVCEQYNIGQ